MNSKLLFLRTFRFWMGIIRALRRNRLNIFILKHTWNIRIGLQEHIWAQNPYGTFFSHPVLIMHLKWKEYISNHCIVVAILYRTAKYEILFSFLHFNLFLPSRVSPTQLTDSVLPVFDQFSGDQLSRQLYYTDPLELKF